MSKSPTHKRKKVYWAVVPEISDISEPHIAYHTKEEADAKCKRKKYTHFVVPVHISPPHPKRV